MCLDYKRIGGCPLGSMPRVVFRCCWSTAFPCFLAIDSSQPLRGRWSPLALADVPAFVFSCSLALLLSRSPTLLLSCSRPMDRHFLHLDCWPPSDSVLSPPSGFRFCSRSRASPPSRLVSSSHPSLFPPEADIIP